MSGTVAGQGTPQHALRGVRVIGLEGFMAGPYCSMLLADMGAEVIKIERPGEGDPRRAMHPFAYNKNGRRVAAGFWAYNRNKKSMTLDLRCELGKQALLDLVGVSDVVVENLRPGALEKLGLDYEVLRRHNPRLIYAMISGFGRLRDRRGPYSDRPAFDIVAEAMGGIMHLVGPEDGPPMQTIYGMADLYSGLVAAYGIMAALFQREHTQAGQVVDIAMYDSVVALNERSLVNYSFTGEVPRRGRERHMGPRGAFRCKDGYVAINVPTDTIWERLAKAIGREDLIGHPKTTDGPTRAQQEDFVRAIVEEWLSDKTREEATELLLREGAPAGPVYTVEDLVRCPQLKARDMLLDVEDPVAGSRLMVRTPVRLSGSSDVPVSGPPGLGEHTDQILSEVLGYDEAKIAELRKTGST